MRLNVGEIADALQVDKPSQPDLQVEGITWDSREVQPGNLYVCFPGERVDGHDFVQQAIAAGAVAVLASREVEADVPVIVVDDTVRAFSKIAAFWRSKLTGTVIGLTGSTGKTTTKNLVRDVLAAAGSVVATLANQNNELGVPRTLLNADADTNAVVVEMGMRGAGQITELCEIAKPNWGLVTNVGESHIELLGSREAIAHAKAELLAALPESGGIAFVNAADEFAVAVCKHADLFERDVKVVFFEGGDAWRNVDDLAIFDGPFRHPFVWGSDVTLDAEGRPSFTMHAAQFDAIGLPDADGQCSCTLELRGMHNVSNACSAAAVGLAAGLSLEQCCAALAQSQPEKGRQRMLHTESGLTVIDDAYNANPDSMAASLATFSAIDASGKRIAVLGDMLELGSFAREGHERMGRLAAKFQVDALICVGELSRAMASSAIGAGMDPAAVWTCDDAPSALEITRTLVGEGDVVLVKASHSIGLEAVVEGLAG